VVTKKRRRRLLARAAAERQAVRRATRDAKRQRIQRILTAVLVVALLAALAFWIATHHRDSEDQPSAGDYSGASAHLSNVVHNLGHDHGATR